MGRGPNRRRGKEERSLECRQEFPPPAWYALGQADGQGHEERQMVTSDATKKLDRSGYTCRK